MLQVATSTGALPAALLLASIVVPAASFPVTDALDNLNGRGVDGLISGRVERVSVGGINDVGITSTVLDIPWCFCI